MITVTLHHFEPSGKYVNTSAYVTNQSEHREIIREVIRMKNNNILPGIIGDNSNYSTLIEVKLAKPHLLYYDWSRRERD